MHDPIRLHITHSQLAKIRNGHPIQIPHAHIGHPQGAVFRHLHPETHKKLARAYHARKGARVHLTHAELEGTGFLDTIRKVGQFIGQHANVLKPLATAALDAGAHFIPAAAPIREGIRKYTGVGIARRATHSLTGPRPRRRASITHSLAGPRPAHHAVGGGIVPAGYAGF